jgi:choline dehydrogenase-like flavoprotein
MFVDARTLPQHIAIDVDSCIVGAGAAGITLARDLARGNRKIAVLESGSFEFDADTQKLYAGAVAGGAYTPLDRDRLRYLGAPPTIGRVLAGNLTRSTSPTGRLDWTHCGRSTSARTKPASSARTPLSRRTGAPTRRGRCSWARKLV